MKKIKILAFAFMFAVLLASSAFAAQASYTVNVFSFTDGSSVTHYIYDYAGTVSGTTYVANGDTYTLVGAQNSYSATAKNFYANGITNYPYEIYLPNEENPASYRIHSNYAKNTDACASCHATHTAVGESLLQWYSAYETCMACHDGTLGTATYNVLGGKIGTSATPASGGMFGIGNGSESSHNVTGAVEIAAAPGGTTVATEQVNGAHGAKNSRWVNEFGCESCHSPHGQGGNARILHPDANYAASWAAEKRTTANKYFVKSDGSVYSDATFTLPVYIIKGYPYSPTIQNGSVAETTYKIDNTSGVSKLVDKTTGAAVTVDSAVYVLGVASLQVKMNIGGYLTSGETVQHVYGMNAYCGACHTDYNTAAFTTSNSGQEETGVYAQAHRHQMGMDWFSATPGLKFESTKVASSATGSMECLTCHVAHGTSQDYWAATLGGSKGADGTLWAAAGTDASYTELAGSSALKRMPNMGTCEACHAKGEGSEGYNVNAGFVSVSTTPDVIDAIFSTVANATHVDETEKSCTTSNCHSDVKYDNNAHTDCQTCHGNASKHYVSPSSLNIINPSQVSFDNSVSKVCGTDGCHDSERDEWLSSKHNEYNTASCITCHESHDTSAMAFKGTSLGALCATCHNTDSYTSIKTAMSKINTDGSLVNGDHSFGYNLVLDSARTLFNVATFKSSTSKMATRAPFTTAQAGHTDLLSTVTQTTCYGDGGSGCHADDAYPDLVSSVHFSQSGNTEGIDGSTSTQPQGMRNRY